MNSAGKVMWRHKAMDKKDTSAELFRTPVVVAAHTLAALFYRE